MFSTHDPSTGAELETYTSHDASTVETRLETATDAFDDWRGVSIEDRTEAVARLAERLRENTEEYASVITQEMGKPITQARGEVEKCAWLCEYYAERAPEQLQDDRIGTEAGVRSLVTYEPLGPVLAIMPWNYPFWQVFRFAVPALSAGNVALLKHSPTTLGCGETIAEIFSNAGFPEGTFQTLRIDTEQVSDVIADSRVAAVTLTGSTRAGRAVAQQAGQELKKTVLELGGSDPYIVLDDADVSAAAETGVLARTQNSGQSCIAAKRLFVHTAVYDQFRESFLKGMEELTVGNPMEEDTDVGPQARADLLEDLHSQVRASVTAGATVGLGGEVLDRSGHFYPPTVLTDVPADCPAMTEELFGPVAALVEVESEAEAIRRANDTPYGLSASIWTEDRDRGERVAREIDAGAAYVNELSKSDPRLPFGGIGDSGYGTELSEHGIKEFTNKKTLWIQ